MSRASSALPRTAPGEEGTLLYKVQGRQYRKRHDPTISLSEFVANGAADEVGTTAVSLDIEVVKLRDKFQTQFHVPREFFGFIIGKKGTKLKEIQMSTKCQVTLPRKNDPSTLVKVTGPTKGSVVDAYEQITSIMEYSREKIPYTHFLSFPLALEPDVPAFYKSLSREVLLVADEKAPAGFQPKMISKAEHFHVTILMLKLLTPEEVAKARAVLEELSADVYDLAETRTLLVRLGGLASMQTDASKTRVLYVNATEKDGGKRMVRICETIRQKFVESGLADDEEGAKELWIHATLLNSRFANLGSAAAPRGQRLTFDAMPFLSSSANTLSLSTRLSSIHLSQRGVYDDNGYYYCEAKIKLP